MDDKCVAVWKKFGPLVFDAQRKFLAVLSGIEGLENVALLKLPKFTNIYRFYFRATKGTIAYINYVGLRLRLSQSQMAKHKEVPAYFPKILCKQDHLSMIVSDEEDEERMVEFNQTDDAVKWRKEYSESVIQEYLRILYSFERAN